MARVFRKLPLTKKSDNSEILEFINRELIPFLNELSKRVEALEP